MLIASAVWPAQLAGRDSQVARLGSFSSTIELRPPGPEGSDAPRRIHRHPRAVGAGLSPERPPRGSQHPFGSGRSLHPLSAPLQRGIRFLHDPLPTAASPGLAAGFVARCRATPHWAYPVPYAEQESGGFRLSTGGLNISVLAPSKPTTDHVPFWSERCGASPTQSISLFQLDGIYHRFAYANPLTQPSASPGFRLPGSRNHPHGRSRPVRGLHCRCAQHEVVTDPAQHLGY